ncbi:hypothetical protein [Metabacillus endolithicus]|uniref:DUF1269 domain-containing protein n=1 Tax=Metabacillus endolithicus TaxID=1535204 RepID=A0ABW5C236_9BACI|nr:hypothetical protein [Metabacillus endolithicus]UPG65791.1 hypothetical protein MVE64_12945 [Metabacillus endolithicus]
MIIVGTFEQSIELEQALAVLESHYVTREQILVTFMESSPKEWLEGRTKSIRSNAFEVGMAVATGSAVVGASLGFILTLGPIICGLLATFIGFAIGYSIYYLNNKKGPRMPRQLPEVTVIIQCLEGSQIHLIKNVLWEYKALTVGVLES